MHLSTNSGNYVRKCDAGLFFYCPANPVIMYENAMLNFFVHNNWVCGTKIMYEVVISKNNYYYVGRNFFDRRYSFRSKKLARFICLFKAIKNKSS